MDEGKLRDNSNSMSGAMQGTDQRMSQSTRSQVSHGFAENLARAKRFSSFFQTDNEEPSRPASVTIMKPVDEVYAFLRDLTNMPKFIRGLQRVDVMAPKLSHWVFEKEGRIHEHDSEMIAEEPGKLFAWRSMGDVKTAKTGVVMFESAPAGRGTVVSLRMSDDQTPGKISGVAAYFGGKDPKSDSYINLRRLKAYLETGEVPTIEGQPNGNDEDNNLRKQ